MRKTTILVCILCFGCSVFFTNQNLNAQSSKNADMLFLRHSEDTLKELASKIVLAREASERFHSDSAFTRTLVRALKTPFSFYYPFDSVINISRLYSPDSSFRIFSWQVVKDEATFRRHGAIQMNTPDGSLKLFPLIDRTFLIEDQKDTITSPEWWMGAIYYKIIEKKNGDKKYYTLLGYDENSIRSTKKRIEVLSFDESGQPVFGGPFFSFENDETRRPVQSRFWIEYKKEGNARMQYDPELDLILYDHLISETNEPAKRYTYIPDGDYEGFKWENGRWMHIDKVFHFKLKDGEAPVEVPLKEDKLGNPTIEPPKKGTKGSN